MNRNKRIYLALIWTVTLGFILFSCIKSIGSLKGVFHTKLNFNTSSEDNTKYENGINENLEKFSNIRIDSNVMKISIREDDSYHINASYNKPKYMPSFRIRNDTLEVSQNIPRGNNSSVNCRLEITVPKGTTLEDIDIVNNVGEIVLKNIDAKELNLETNVGEINVKKINFKELKAETNVGDVKVTMNEDLDDYEVEAKVDVGEIKIGSQSAKRSYKQKGKNGRKIKAVANVGSVELD